MREFWNRFKLYVSDYFVFTTGEKRGTLLLLIIIIACLGGMAMMNFLPHPTTDFSKFKNEIESIEKINSKADPVSGHPFFKQDSVFSYPEKKELNSYAAQKFFDFDPNTLSDSGWMCFGLSQKQVNVLNKYKSKGGHFFKKEDLKKMYVINDALYSRLNPYIKIVDSIIPKKQFSDSSKTASNVFKNKYDDQKKLIVELNTASQEELDQLPGVGKWIAAYIVKYRDKLGGYFDKTQLLEVKYFSDSLYSVIENQVIVNTSYIRKININTSDFKSLLHPYLDYNTASLISNYKKMHGNFSSAEELLKTKLMDEETYKKLMPYLGVQ